MEFGKIEYTCRDRGNGGPSVRTLHLTLIGLEDKDILEREGVKGLRLNRIRRLTSEAVAQSCLLSYEDLSTLLLTSLATLKRDIALLEKAGNPVALKGRRRKRHDHAPEEREGVRKAMMTAAGKIAGGTE